MGLRTLLDRRRAFRAARRRSFGTLTRESAFSAPQRSLKYLLRDRKNRAGSRGTQSSTHSTDPRPLHSRSYAQSPNAVPFAQATYTLRVYDSRGPDATAQPGLFNGANSILTFAMYFPAQYTSLADGWTCQGCSAAVRRLTSVESGVWVALPVTLGLVLIGGAGVLGR